MRKLFGKISKYIDKILAGYRKSKLNNTDFTIISNNCWGHFVYSRYALPYLTPTIGMYIFPDDFVKLCHNLRYYMELPLEFITYRESKHKDAIIAKEQTNIPIGKLDDVEIVFLHYKTEELAREKWERRAKRINYDNLIFKFTKMNGCTKEELKRFDALECDKKICFVPPEDKNLIKCAVPFKSAKGKSEVTNDTIEYDRYINLTKLINADKAEGLNMSN